MDLRSGIVRVETAPASSLGVVVRGTRVCAPLAVPHRGVPSRVPACRRDRHGASARMGSRQPLCRVADGTQRAAAGGSSGRPPVPARAAIRARRCRRPRRGSGGAVLVVRRRRRGSPHRDGVARRPDGDTPCSARTGAAALSSTGLRRQSTPTPSSSLCAEPSTTPATNCRRSGRVCSASSTAPVERSRTAPARSIARSASSPISFRNVSRSSCQRRLPAGRVPCTGRSSQTSRKRSAPESGTLRSIRSWLRYPGNRRD